MEEKISCSDVVETFDTYGISLNNNHDIINKCLELCRVYGDPEAIAVCWLSFASANGYDKVLLENLEQFEKEELVKNKKKKESATRIHPEFYDASTIDTLVGPDDDLLAVYGRTPNRKRAPSPATSSGVPPKCRPGVAPTQGFSAQFSPSLSPKISTPSQKFSSRSNAGQVVVAFGQASETPPDANWFPKVNVVPLGEDGVLGESCKYMFEKARDVVEVLEDVLMAMADQFKDDLSLGGWTSVRMRTNEPVASVGRVCCDSVGRLNAASVLLEGSLEVSYGDTVPLDLSQVEGSFSLFPGQIICVKGDNATGARLQVREILQGKILPTPDNVALAGMLRIVVACGPFTTSDNLLYEPLLDFLQVVLRDPPHLLVLMGPFLDAAHPLVAGELAGERHESTFARCLNAVTETLDGCPTQVVFVANSKDVLCPLVYPTPAMSCSGPKVVSLSDPAIIEVEGLTVGLTSTDVLLHLGKEEVAFPSHGADRMGRLARHILLQQSFYPLYPPPEDLCLSYESLYSHGRLPFTPHLLVLPSDLRCFAKDVEGCLVVNPERLAKGLVGGSYAVIEVDATTKSSSLSSILDCTSVQIIKI